MLTIQHLFVSPGHDFFGRHGQPRGMHGITEVDEVECVAGRGLKGDRFFDYRPDYKGQITLFASEVLAGLRMALGLSVDPSTLRRNVIVEGGDLNALIGREFMLQDVRLHAVEECRPCYWMDLAMKPGAEAWLRSRGGLRCRILTSGTLHRAARTTPASDAN